jgi:hypothetical protein
VTFGEVPVGHVFRFHSWACGCLLRKVDDNRFRVHWVQPCCEWHAGSDTQKSERVSPIVVVKYDPFVAMLEAGEVETA